MLPISVCLIAKNEQTFINKCLQALIRYDWEVIVVDTGSSDRTREIALEYTPYVFDFPWNNNFSIAKNYCISKAKNNWILSIDCDEYLTCLSNGMDLGQIMFEYMADPRKLGTIELRNPQISSGNQTISIERVSRFFHREYYHFEGAVHEQLVPSRNQSIEYMDLPISFYHKGYSDPTILAKKADRNLRLLRNELDSSKENKQNPYLFFQIGQSYFILGDMKNACSYFEKGLSLNVEPTLQYVQTMVESYGYCLLKLKQLEKALQFENIYDTFCDRADFVFLMGLIYMENGMFHNAIEQFAKATTISKYTVEGVNSYSAFYNIGVIYECTENRKEAEIYYRKCGEYRPALDGLKRLNTTEDLR